MRHSMKRSTIVAGVFTSLLATGAHAAMTISNAQTRNVNCASSLCEPTGGNANLNVGELQTMLASSNVTVKSNATAPDIGIVDSLTWASSRRLTLDAYQSIHVRAPVVVEGTSGLTLTTNDGGTGGDYNFNAATSGSITFWDTASKLVINGQSFPLVDYNTGTPRGFPGKTPRRFALAKNFDASDWGMLAGPKFPSFNGTFEGLGNTISNLSIYAQGYNQTLATGLFGVLHLGGVIRDINLASANISGVEHLDRGRHPHPSYMGALAGLVKGGIIDNCTASGTVHATAYWMVGGLVGENSGGTISSSSFSGNVMTPQVFPGVGGLVGFNSGTISRSTATTDFNAEGGALVGGLVGENLGVIEQSGASIDAQAQSPKTQGGGLVGKNDSSGTITGSHATGETLNAAGLAVENDGAITQSFATGVAEYGDGFVENNAGTITNSYSTTASTLGDLGASMGGFAGYNTGTIKYAYAAGPVSSTNYCGAGFVVGDFTDDFKDDYWDKTTTGQRYGGCNVNYAGVKGVSDAKLKSALPVGFDPNVWGQSASINNGWPYLLANPPPQ